MKTLVAVKWSAVHQISIILHCLLNGTLFFGIRTKLFLWFLVCVNPTDVRELWNKSIALWCVSCSLCSECSYSSNLLLHLSKSWLWPSLYSSLIYLLRNAQAQSNFSQSHQLTCLSFYICYNIFSLCGSYLFESAFFFIFILTLNPSALRITRPVTATNKEQFPSIKL